MDGPCNTPLTLPSYPQHPCGLHHTIPGSLHWIRPLNPDVLGTHRGWEWARGALVVGSLEHLLFQAVICVTTPVWTTTDMLKMKAPLQNNPWKVKSCSSVWSWCSSTALNVLNTNCGSLPALLLVFWLYPCHGGSSNLSISCMWSCHITYDCLCKYKNSACLCVFGLEIYMWRHKNAKRWEPERSSCREMKVKIVICVFLCFMLPPVWRNSKPEFFLHLVSPRAYSKWNKTTTGAWITTTLSCKQTAVWGNWM